MVPAEDTLYHVTVGHAEPSGGIKLQVILVDKGCEVVKIPGPEMKDDIASRMQFKIYNYIR